MAWNENEFNQLVENCRLKVVSHISAILKNEADVQDVWQQAVIKAFHHQEQFERRSQFSTWFWRIAHNCAIDVLRKRKYDLPLVEQKSKEETPVESDQIIKFAEKLPKKHKEVFLLYAVEQKSQKEIAILLNIPYGTVRSRLFTARKLFLQLIEQEMI